MTVILESKPLPALRNSPEAIRRFPFPFATDGYMYSVNLVPAGQGISGAFDEHVFDIDEHYVTEMMERGRILAEDHDRRCLTLPHMMDAQWDFLEMGMTHLAADYPQHFSLERDGNQWHWENRLLGSAQRFVRPAVGRPRPAWQSRRDSARLAHNPEVPGPKSCRCAPGGRG